MILLLCLAIGDADVAFRAVETQAATAKGKQEKSLEAIEKALKNSPLRCAPCPAAALCETPLPLQPQPAAVVSKPAAPWLWITLAAFIGTAVGVSVTAGVMSVHKEPR